MAKARRSARPTKKSHTMKIALSKSQVARAEKCIERTGKVTIGMKKISVTRLPASLKPASVIID